MLRPLMSCLPILVLTATTAVAASRGAGAASHGAPEQVATGISAPSGSDGSVEPAISPAEKRYPWALPRATEDRPDERTGRMIHVVYVVPSDFPDERLDILGMIEDSMRSANHWFQEQTGDKRWRLDTYTFEWDDPATPAAHPRSVQAVDVSFVQSNLPSELLNHIDEVDSELITRGFRDPGKRYLAYVASDAGTRCGDAWYQTSSNPDAPFDGRYAAVYLNGSADCRTREFATGPTSPSYTETVAMQELMHNDGMVPPGAPHGCEPGVSIFLGHVCLTPVALLQPDLDPDRVDVMFPFVGLPLSQKVLDRDRDDYFRQPVGLRDLDDGLYLERVGD